MSDSTRVVLVKPSDVLLVGNVGAMMRPEFAQPAAQFFRDIGIQVVFFAADVDIDVASGVIPEVVKA